MSEYELQNVSTDVKFDDLWKYLTSHSCLKTHIFPLTSDWTKPLRGSVALDLLYHT